VVQDPVGEDQVDALVGQGDGGGRATSDPVVRKPGALETERHSSHGFVRHIHPGPPGTPAYQPLRLGSLAKANLEHPLAPHVELIEASGDMAFQAIAVCVVGVEECGVVTLKALVQATCEVITTRVCLPKLGDLRLSCHLRPPIADTIRSRTRPLLIQLDPPLWPTSSEPFTEPVRAALTL
jgi:hypothetical protein